MQGELDRLERGMCGIEGVSLRDKYGMKLEKRTRARLCVCVWWGEGDMAV